MPTIKCFLIEPMEPGRMSVKGDFENAPLWRRLDNGDEFPLSFFPAGAMWFATWLDSWLGPDGKCLIVRTPDGEWMVDGPSTQHPNEAGWTRTGEAPNITAHPSIICGSYHGWLRNGELVDA